MKTSIHYRHSSRQLTIRMRFLTHAVAMATLIYSGSILAQTNISTVPFPSVPLVNATAAPANLLYIHDDSNSMYWSFMPDEIHWQSSDSPDGYNYEFYNVPFEFYRSPNFNKLYYNPDVQYVPPPAPPGVAVTGADGKPVTDGTLGNAQFTSAWFNGYDLATRNQTTNYFSYTVATPLNTGGTVPRRVNLATGFVQTDYTSRIFGGNYAYPIKGVRRGTRAVTCSSPTNCAFTTVGTDRYCYWEDWATGQCGTGEFLPMNPEAAHYYKCPPNAWATYPNPTGPASRFNLGLCTKVVITTEAEKQNFANWYSYYRTRNYASKAGIGRAFEKLDSSIRVGWGLINKRDLSSVDGKNVNTLMQGVRQFDQARKVAFLDWLYKIQPAGMNNPSVFASQLTADVNKNYGGATPLRKALDSAGQYYDRSNASDSLGPWADNPAAPKEPKLETAAACRQSFTILMTDGYWNSDAGSITGNADGSAPFPFKDNHAGTLADAAWYYWNKKLVPDSIESNVPKTPAPDAPNKFRDNAEHQHMTTFTIGLGVAGSIDKDKALRAIHDTSVGSFTWPNPLSGIATFEKIDDLLHAAVNGHGDFFSASNPDEFVHGMSAIINTINASQKTSSGNMDANTPLITPLETDVYLYKTYFKPNDWRGELIAQKFDANTGFENEVWLASEQMPAPVARKIYTLNSNGSGIYFEWSALSNTLQSALKGPGQLLKGQEVLDYVRGSSEKEGLNSGQFRIRYRFAPNRAPLGPSPHNSPVFVQYESGSSTVFLGANDGMLHAFDAATGVEQFAYIPSALILKLSELTSGHSSYVDGEVLVTTPTQTPGRNLLVGALGRGGKGLYGLDVSNPADFLPGHVKWEFSSPQNCPDPNPVSAWLGNVIGALAYAKVDGTPSAVFGNGYNSCSNKAALGIVNIDDGSAHFIKVSDELGNGLAAPHVRTDTATAKVSAYAGDLRGNMWKFDSISPVAPPQPRKLLEAGASQPITARPVTAALNLTSEVKRVFVHFGTGRYLSISDRSDTSPQSIYGLIDAEGSTLPLRPDHDLKKRVFDTAVSVNGALAKSIRPLDSNPDMDTWKGWYIPLVDTGERVVSSPLIVQTARGDVAIFTTIIPSIGNDSCSSRGTGWLYVVNAQTGSALDFVFLDLNGDGEFDDKDMINGENPSAIKIGDLIGGMPGQAKIINGQLVNCAMNSSDCTNLRVNLHAPPPEPDPDPSCEGPSCPCEGPSCKPPPARKGNRISWREIIH